MGYLISGKKVGILGFGRIGQKVGLLLRAFETEIGFHDVCSKSGVFTRYMDLADLLGWADILCIHVSKPTTAGYLLGKKEIASMKNGSWIVNWWLGSSWRKARPYIAPAYLEELRGLAEASGVALRELYLVHAIPDRTYSCSNFAAWGQATAGGQLIHMRNLDWTVETGIQDHAVVFVVHPAGKQPFVNVGWAGFIGVLTGVNAAQISIGQVGAETVDATVRGEPMVFLMRRILEEAEDLDEVAALIRNARRTVGVNYVVADAKAKRGIVL